MTGKLVKPIAPPSDPLDESGIDQLCYLGELIAYWAKSLWAASVAFMERSTV